MLSAQNKLDEEFYFPQNPEALHLDPKNELAHDGLVLAHSKKGDWLANKSDWDEAFAEFNEALRLNPNDELAHEGLFLAHLRKGQELAREKANGTRPLQKSTSHYAWTPRTKRHGEPSKVCMGRKPFRLWKRVTGMWQSRELREAQQLDPKDANVHDSIGFALESKGDVRGALEEYRAAYMLDPKNATYKQNYDRLLQQVNQ